MLISKTTQAASASSPLWHQQPHHHLHIFVFSDPNISQNPILIIAVPLSPAMVTVVIRGQPLQSHLTSFYRLLLHHLHQTCFFLLLISPSFPSPEDDPIPVLDLLGLAPSACRPCTSTITQHPKASVHTSQCKLHIDSCSQETGGTSTHKKCGFQTSGVATVAHKGSK